MLRDKRLAKGMTIEALSKASGVSRVSINRYELGTRIPNVIVAMQLANALGCSVEEIAPPPESVQRTDYGT